MGPSNDGTVLYTHCYQERRLDIGTIQMLTEYISADNYTNVEYLDTVINLFANLIQIEERDEEPTQNLVVFTKCVSGFG